MAKTKALISCAVTALLICIFVFAYANCWFSHAGVHVIKNSHRFQVIVSSNFIPCNVFQVWGDEEYPVATVAILQYHDLCVSTEPCTGEFILSILL